MKQRLALVTGTSRGIGYSIAKKLLSESYKVIGTSTKDESPFPNDANYTHIKSDLNNPDEVEKTLKSLFHKNTPDVLINNAGIFIEAQFSSSDNSWLDAWDKTFQVNLKSPALLCKWAINAWEKSSKEGIIINISSRAAYRGDTQEYAAYSASKAGMAGLSKSIARSFSKKGITAFTICPGFVETDMARDSIEVYGADYLTKDLALSEIAPPEQIAEMAFLISTGKISHMTGQSIHINSGSYIL